MAETQQAEKRCTGCNKTKPLTDFTPMHAGKLGRMPQCKACRAAAARIRYQKRKNERLNAARASLEYTGNQHRYGTTPDGEVVDYMDVIIEVITRKITEHGDTLSAGSARRTNAALVEPILNFMDWDTADPEMVLPDLDGMDYGLIWNNKTVAAVNTRPLQSPPHDADEAIAQCRAKNIPFLIETDGDHWLLRRITPETAEQVHEVLLTAQPTEQAVERVANIFQTIDERLNDANLIPENIQPESTLAEAEEHGMELDSPAFPVNNPQYTQ